MRTFSTALRATLVTLVLTGLVYPLGMTALAQLCFPSAANGSLVSDENGKRVGSHLIGQSFAKPGYFQPRPSAAGNGYDPMTSGGSNFGPTSAKLRERAGADARRLRAENPESKGEVPAELVTASGSGLDPHISPASARWQVARVARARGISKARIESVVDEFVVGRDFGLLGAPTVNVLELNLALDRQFGRPAGGS